MLAESLDIDTASSFGNSTNFDFDWKKTLSPNQEAVRIVTWREVRNISRISKNSLHLDSRSLGLEPLTDMASEHLIKASDSREEILAILSATPLRWLSSRLNELLRFEEDEPDAPPMDIESMRNMVLFLWQRTDLLTPEISTSPKGLASCEWQLRQDGILAMEFLARGMVRYACVSAEIDEMGERERANGVTTRKNASSVVSSFFEE